MRAKITGAILSGFLMCALGALAAAADAAKPKPKVTFQDQVSGVFKNRCNSCHNGDKQKGGLNLESFGGTMQGGGSGKVVEPGDPDGSRLLELVAHKDEPKMPPNSPKIPDAEIDLIRQWIEGGALETSGSVAAVKAKPKFEFKLDPTAMGKPSGPPAMPQGLIPEPSVVSTKPTAVVALASSPWAPLVAVGGHKQVLLYRSTDNHLVGVFPFPEGTIHVLKFSRGGDLLLAGGGRGGQSGLAVVFDVKTGKRVFEIGKEYDAVLSADISPDQGLVALGGPSKILRVYSTADGQLVYESKKHTEWVTAIEFSPDGVLLASGDRNNGLMVWEAQTGREFYDLRGHQAAITDISWRLDSNVVASASEDGTVRLWEMQNGGQIKSWGAHGGGVASARFAKDGRLVTAGRDRVVRLWDQNGNKQRDFEAFGDLALEAIFTQDETRVVGGDWSGELRVWNVADGARLANLAANPAPIAVRLDQTKAVLAQAETAVQQLLPIQNAPTEKAAIVTKAQQALAAAQQQVAQQTAQVNAADQAFIRVSATEKIAGDLVAATVAIAQKTTAEKGAADKTLADKAAAEKAATDALAAAQAGAAKAQADKAAQDKAVAAAQAAVNAATDPNVKNAAMAELAKQTQRVNELAGAVNVANNAVAAAQTPVHKPAGERAVAAQAVVVLGAQDQAAAAALQARQTEVQKATADKNVAAKTLTDLRTGLQASNAALAARANELNQANAAKAAADQALAANKPAIDAAIARVAALKAELDALTAEKKLSETAKGSVATTANPKAS
ncbi:MAG: hypothetical protein P4L84_08970 [Isosphaeraceae bacterium]|nr:hypothetical protein [Isosphaeraceae bacterium]